MFKIFKKWNDDWAALNKELADQGMYFHCTAYGAWIQNIKPIEKEAINTADDKS
jgi:predicted SpoU family rRNA methylase|tara:strand:+ start:260 stop:421 length:162 start_codon:yes stop_codon:yes gene_type:complete